MQQDTYGNNHKSSFENGLHGIYSGFMNSPTSSYEFRLPGLALGTNSPIMTNQMFDDVMSFKAAVMCFLTELFAGNETKSVSHKSDNPPHPAFSNGFLFRVKRKEHPTSPKKKDAQG